MEKLPQGFPGEGVTLRGHHLMGKKVTSGEDGRKPQTAADRLDPIWVRGSSRCCQEPLKAIPPTSEGLAPGFIKHQARWAQKRLNKMWFFSPWELIASALKGTRGEGTSQRPAPWGPRLDLDPLPLDPSPTPWTRSLASLGGGGASMPEAGWGEHLREQVAGWAWGSERMPWGAGQNEKKGIPGQSPDDNPCRKSPRNKEGSPKEQAEKQDETELPYSACKLG